MDDFEPFENGPVGPPEEDSAQAVAAIEQRVWRNLLGSIAFFIILSAFLASGRFTLGVILGGALAIWNYRWLHDSLKKLLAAVTSGAAPPTTTESMIKFIGRWIVILVILVIAAQWGGQQLLLGITLGLLSIAFAIMIEAATQVRDQLKKD